MMVILLQGLAVSLGLIVAIGPQNAYLLRQGIARSQVTAVALTCFLSDAILLAAGIGMAGVLATIHPWLEIGLLWGGIIFLLLFAAASFRRAAKESSLIVDEGQTSARQIARTAPAAIGMTLALTWLNPHAYLDTFVLIGGIATALNGLTERFYFWIGAIIGSAIWFFGVGYGATKLTPFFASSKAWRTLDIIIGCLMSLIAAVVLFTSAL